MILIKKCLSAGFGVGGCLALLAALGCATTPRTSEERASDVVIAEGVEAALGTDSRIYARHVDVNVDRSVVHLGGYVWSDSESQFAKADAAAVPGVLGVADEIELMRGGVSGTSR